MQQSMCIESPHTPLLNFQNRTSHSSPHVMFTFTVGALHTSVHIRCVWEEIVCALSLVRIKFFAYDVGRGEFLDAPCSFTI
jgi:hypothetical protein